MPLYQTTLLSRTGIAERTMAFLLKKPPGFQFRPGQYVDLALIDPPETDSQGAIRSFSIASAPFEENLMVATRMRDSAFKRAIGRLPLGTAMKLDGPMGSFTLHASPAKAAVFLAGGIGITPFRSILRQAVHEKLPHLTYLFSANRRPEDSPFLDELQELSRANPRVVFVPVMSKMETSKREWSGERGYIGWDLLSKHFCELKGPIYYIAGPPPMVAAMRQVLLRAEVDDNDVHIEEFGGY